MSEETPTLYCANHARVATSLRCNRCEKPICSKCAVLTPTGYRCKECIRGQQRSFETARWTDYPLGIGVAAVLSFIGSLLATNLGFFTIFIAPIAGTGIAEAVRYLIQRRRSKLLYRLITAAALLGSLPLLINNLIIVIVILTGSSGPESLLSLTRILWPGLYAIVVTSTIYYRLSGVVINR
ncbi:MAG: hypothetical protein JW862_08700 [Anaerolineales bacterium]|nr:hypothetical protein [Anaerolineales bacterium]